jgi:type IV secretion system protein VirB10
MNPQRSYDAPGDPRRKLNNEDLADAQVTGYPVVANQYARRDRAGLMLGGSIAILLGAATLFAMAASRKAPLPPPQPQQTQAALAAAPQPIPVAPPAPVVTPTAAAPAPAPLPPPPAMAPPPPIVNPAIAMDRLRSPALVLDNGPSNAAAPPAPAVPLAPRQVSRDGMSAEELFAQRIGENAESTPMRRMKNPSATVSQGTLMTAVLETAINSDLPGFVRAVVSQDVKSYDGKRVLIPRGSRLVGEYKSNLAVGQSRAYILWTRLLRPDGSSMALASPATDFSGSNGLSGKVDNHFFKRFGAAILLSAIGAAGQAVGGGNGAVIIAGPQQALSAGAQRDMNIPPTIKVGLGQPIRIFTARDLDFSDLDTGE